MNNKENETSIRKAPGFASWPFNDIMMETSKGEYRKQWRFIGLTYLIYVVCITILDHSINHFFEKSIASGSIIPVLAGYILAALVCVPFIVIIGKRTQISLGIQNENIARNEFSGWIAAGLVLLMVLGINLLLGGLEIKLNSNINILMLLFMFIGFLLQGFMEEFLLRSLIMTQLSLRLGVVIGILLNSFIFAIGHAANQDASIISVANTFLLGLLFSFMYYYHDNLWFVAGFHSGWNFILGPVLGVTVSGFNLPTYIFNSIPVAGKSLLNGGVYGFEASLPVTILTILLCIIYLIMINKKNKALKRD